MTRRKKWLVVGGAAALLVTVSFLGYCLLAPALRLHLLLPRVAEGEVGIDDALADLGGRQAAARATRMYLRLPRWFTRDRRTAVSFLGGGGKHDVPTLVRILESEQETVETRVNAAWAMVSLGEDARSGVPVLARLMTGPDSVVSAAAWSALKHLGPHAEPALPRLVQMLGGENKSDPWVAAKVLERMGAAAGPAVPSLVNALEDSDPTAREAVIAALGETAHGNDGAITALRRIASDPSDELREAAAEALSKLEPEAGKRTEVSPEHSVQPNE